MVFPGSVNVFHSAEVAPGEGVPVADEAPLADDDGLGRLAVALSWGATAVHCGPL
jgi:hypothetical protein